MKKNKHQFKNWNQYNSVEYLIYRKSGVQQIKQLHELIGNYSDKIK